MERTSTLATAMLLILGIGQASASKLDDELDQRLRGAWAVLEVEVWSSCSGTYSDNTIGAGGVASKADQRLFFKLERAPAIRQGFDVEAGIRRRPKPRLPPLSFT